MEPMILIIFLGLVAIFSVLVDRRWQRRALSRQQEQPTVQPAPLPVVPDQSNTLMDQIKANWHKRMGWRTQAETEQSKLRDWLVTSLADYLTTQRWVAGLNDTEFSALYQQLHAFCTSLQIDLAWLGGQPLAQDPTLQAAIQAVVLHYVQAQQQAAGMQAELQAFKTYRVLEQQPYSDEYQPMLHQLYTQLVRAGLAAPARPEALLATEKIRIEHMLRAIQSAAAADRPAFYQVINSLSHPDRHHGAAPSLSPTAPSNSQPATASTP